jgi:hypothetical protein
VKRTNKFGIEFEKRILFSGSRVMLWNAGTLSELSLYFLFKKKVILNFLHFWGFQGIS